jgi:hypothetical protein
MARSLMPRIEADGFDAMPFSGIKALACGIFSLPVIA